MRPLYYLEYIFISNRSHQFSLELIFTWRLDHIRTRVEQNRQDDEVPKSTSLLSSSQSCP
jgi:hypothetical protein